MRRNKFLITVLAVLACLACGVEVDRPSYQKAVAEGVRSGSLEEISRPYLGVYECKSLQFGGEDKKNSFDYFRVELTSNGELIVSYKPKNGQVNRIPLTYEYHFEEKEVWVRGQWGVLKVDKKFPLKNGTLSVVMSIFGKVAVVEFTR